MGAPPDFFHYLPVTDADLQLGVYLTGAGRATIPANAIYPHPGHPGLYHFTWDEGRVLPEFQLILLTRGDGELESAETGPMRLPANSLLLLFPGVWHRYRPNPARGWHERWISINGEIPHRLVDQQLLSARRPVHALTNPTEIAAAFDRTLERVHSDPTRHSAIVGLGALELLALAAEHSLPPQPDPVASPPRYGIRDPLVARALELIWTRSHGPLSVAQIARCLHTTRRTLERRAGRALGRSLLQEINFCRLSRARRLLEETELQVKAVAYLAGFSHPERLRALALRALGQTPSAYRRERRARGG